jgi:DNA-binding phage protein
MSNRKLSLSSGMDTKMAKETASYRDWLGAKLVDPKRSARYLDAALQDSPEMFLKALRKVAESRQMAKVPRNGS